MSQSAKPLKRTVSQRETPGLPSERTLVGHLNCLMTANKFIEKLIKARKNRTEPGELPNIVDAALNPTMDVNMILSAIRSSNDSRSASRRVNMPGNPLLERQLEFALDVINKLRKKPNGHVFGPPVNEKAHQAKGYYTKIRLPRFLDTIQADIMADKYTDIDILFRDLKLVFENAQAFNPDTHWIHGLAKKMHRAVITMWRNLPTTIAPQQKRVQPTPRPALRKEREREPEEDGMGPRRVALHSKLIQHIAGPDPAFSEQ
ncbi:hypothetical protein KIPB_011667, partial [Kipferlia bialata]|eukprot:g11667.t1